MVCEEIKAEHGRMIVCRRGQRAPWAKPCISFGCRVPSTQLCDYPRGAGTCDAPICREHATAVGPDLDYCPKHADAAPRGAGGEN